MEWIISSLSGDNLTPLNVFSSAQRAPVTQRDTWPSQRRVTKTQRGSINPTHARNKKIYNFWRILLLAYMLCSNRVILIYSELLDAFASSRINENSSSISTGINISNILCVAIKRWTADAR